MPRTPKTKHLSPTRSKAKNGRKSKRTRTPAAARHSARPPIAATKQVKNAKEPSELHDWKEETEAKLKAGEDAVNAQEELSVVNSLRIQVLTQLPDVMSLVDFLVGKCLHAALPGALLG